MEEDGTMSKSHLPCRDVPVMDIVKAYRELMTGTHGRKAHRAFPVPTYEYEKGRTQTAKEAMAKALASQMPIVVQVQDEPTHTELPGAAPGPEVDAALPGAAPGPEVDTAQVDATQDGGHFARFGEMPQPNLGPDAGEHLGTRRVMGGK
jgi:hypothetical protein